MTEFLPFALPDIGEEEIEEVVDSLRSGWLTTGPKTKRFEEDFATFVGDGVEAIAVNSATAGLHLALEAIGIGPGDEVITTPYTFTATAEVIRYLGAHPVFVDINPTTFNIDPLKIEKAITQRTKAIIPVHFAGLACDMDPIMAIAKKYGLKIVEDAAHSLPTTYHGKLIGTFESDATVYSFYVTKTIATGEGGMIVLRDAEIAKRCRVMRLHGINRDVFNRYANSKRILEINPHHPAERPELRTLAVHAVIRSDADLQHDGRAQFRARQFLHAGRLFRLHDQSQARLLAGIGGCAVAGRRDRRAG